MAARKAAVKLVPKATWKAEDTVEVTITGTIQGREDDWWVAAWLEESGFTWKD